jgi:hypothetical protein
MAYELHQLRLETPAGAELVDGVKRDIRLLDGVEAGAGDHVTVLDISLDSNRRGPCDCWRREQASNILITDMDMAAHIRSLQAGDHHAAHLLPYEAWARRETVFSRTNLRTIIQGALMR